MGGHRNFSRGGNADILVVIFKLLTLQCKWTFTTRFTVSTPQRKFSHERTRSIHINFEIFFKWSCRLYEFATKVYFLSSVTTFAELAHKCRYHCELHTNESEVDLTINNDVCGSLICLCWLNRIHF